jgi:gluconate kinase
MQGIGKSTLVHLRGSIEFIRARMATREHKYMPAALLESQFDTLEPPQDAVEIGAELAVDEAVARIRAALATKDPARTP